METSHRTKNLYSMITSKDVCLVSAGVILSTILRRLLLTAHDGAVRSRGGFWNRMFRRRGQRHHNLSASQRYGHFDSTMDPLSQRLGLSRIDVDKIICAQYGTSADDNGVNDDHANCSMENSFSYRIGILAERYCPALKDFTGENGQTTALEIGCLTGGVSFELAKSFQSVYACDRSQECIQIAESMKERGWVRCRVLRETEIYEEKTVTVDGRIDRDRVSFAHLDFEDICIPSSTFQPKDPFDCVVLLSLTRTENPMLLLDRLVELVAPKGICVLGSAFEWCEAVTPRDKWLGGYVGKDGSIVSNTRTIRICMEKYFTLVHAEDVPFIMKESMRREIVTTYSISVWMRT